MTPAQHRPLAHLEAVERRVKRRRVPWRDWLRGLAVGLALAAVAAIGHALTMGARP
jgi:hypothetical protein